MQLIKTMIGIIPARGGSKGLPGKNVMDFCGKPLLAWTIICARDVLDHIVVSTDDLEIAKIARRFGADVVMRPAELSTDDSPSEDALIHALEKSGLKREAVLFLQATSPLREPFELEEAIEQFYEKKLDSLFSGARPEDLTMWVEDEIGLYSSSFDYLDRANRQRRKNNFWLETGSFYITKTELLMKTRNRLGGKIGVYPVPFWKSIEIDSLESAEVAAALMRAHGLA